MSDLIKEMEQRLRDAGYTFEDAANEAYAIGYAHGQNEKIKLPITEIYGDPDLAAFYTHGWEDARADKMYEMDQEFLAGLESLVK